MQIQQRTNLTSNVGAYLKIWEACYYPSLIGDILFTEKNKDFKMYFPIHEKNRNPFNSCLKPIKLKSKLKNSTRKDASNSAVRSETVGRQLNFPSSGENHKLPPSGHQASIGKLSPSPNRRADPAKIPTALSSARPRPSRFPRPSPALSPPLFPPRRPMGR